MGKTYVPHVNHSIVNLIFRLYYGNEALIETIRAYWLYPFNINLSVYKAYIDTIGLWDTFPYVHFGVY
jgi:hypothetical protein